jgi:diaminopimelate epimerase
VGIEFVKGHGTENDFVVLPDADGTLELTDARVRALCDRSRGLGADGVLRVLPTKLVPDGPSGLDPDSWFMDYRNADGSIAEMCGNGVRVFAGYLVASGAAAVGELNVGTRAGNRPVVVHADGRVTVQMGPARIEGRSTATIGGQAFEGVAVDVGNPHLVCVTGLDVAEFDLTVPPGHDPAVFPHGVNVEFVNELGPEALRMRVHERGVGETRSCGTGTVAVLAGFLHLAGKDTGMSTVDVPGGQVVVTVGEGVSTLTGPAVLVARGELSDDWWASAGHA